MKIRMRGMLVLLGLFGLLAMISGCGKKEIASINGQKITRDEFVSRLEQIPVQTANGTRLAGDLVMRKLIDEALVLQYAKDRGVAPTEEQINQRIERVKRQEGVNLEALLKQSGMTLEDYKRQQAFEQALVNIISKNITVSESEIQKAYQQALKDPKSGLRRPEQRLISIISVSKKNLPVVQKRLNSGENFALVARELSEDPTGKTRNGQLTWIDRSMKGVPPAIMKAAFETKVSKYSDPIFVDGKYYFVRVDAMRDAKVISYDEVKDVLRDRIAVAKGMQRGDFRKDMQEYFADAKININVSKYKDIAKDIKESASAGKTELTPSVGANRAP